MSIDTPGLYDMPADAYHADPVGPAPSLSASIAHTLVSRSARHAWFEHPRLNPDHDPGEPTSEMEEGTALHALLLERQDRVIVVDAKDWRKGEPQKVRNDARAAGRVAILAHRWEALRATAEAIRAALAQHDIGDVLGLPGAAEQVMVWWEETEAGPIWCRARVDWLPDTLPAICDLKTVGGSADPGAWGRNALTDGRATQAVHYLRGARALGLPHRRFLFLVLERDAPHGVSVCELDPALLGMAEERLAYARNMWAACLRDGDWPSYPPLVATIEAPGFAAYQHEEWKLRVETVRKRRPRRGLVSEAFIVNSESPFA